MKKRTLLYSLLTTIAMTLCFVLSSTGAWFTHNITLEDSLDGATEGAYFAYGDGSKDSPYGITNARHLYNLSWLQYLGRFNKDNDQDGKLDTVYFELGSDIDMEGYTALPPIGTTEYPFIGNFTGMTSHNTIDSSQNGKCHTISNLTVTNDFSQYTYHATTAQESDFGDSSSSVTQIVGFFGVVGSYNGSPSDATYDTSANSISNVGLDGLTVQTVASSTLIGLVAGYVNGTISGVPVNNSTIDIKNTSASYINTRMTSNLSDYSLIGYAAKDDYWKILQSSETTTDVPEISNPYLSQGGDDWGGSIDMQTMFTNLDNKASSASSSMSTEYLSYEKEERDAKLDEDGNLDPITSYTPVTSATEKQTYTFSNNWYGKNHKFLQDKGTDDKGNEVITGSYTFYQETYYQKTYYVGLSGRHKVTIENAYAKDYVTHMTSDAIYISSGNNYLSTSNTSIINSTSQTTAWIWNASTGYLYTVIGDDFYYLNASGSDLVLSTTKSTTWTWDTSASLFKTDTSYYLIYSDTWKLSTSASDSYYTISSGSNYLSTSGTSINTSGTTDSSSAAHWYFENGDSGYVYTWINNTKYYLVVSITNGYGQTSTSLSLSTSTTNAMSRSGNTISVQITTNRRTRTYYLSYSSDWWSSEWEVSTSNSSVTITHQTISYQTTTTATTNWDQTKTDTKSVDVYTYPTYFPLNWESGSTVNPSNKNTGYVVGGDYYDGSDNNESIGDIRFSKYYETNKDLYNSFIGGKDSSYSANNLFAYTFNSKGTLVKIGDPVNGKTNDSGYNSYSDLGFKKYYNKLAGTETGSRIGLDSMLSNSSGIAYGVHFMNAQISNDHKFAAPYVKINGTEYTDYELPEDSFDFNLKSGGYVNFFAHTGYVNYEDSSKTKENWSNSNNSFFSLHWINRNGSKIDEIKEIAKIYKNTDYDNDNSQPQYVYTYRDSNDNENTTDYDTGVKDSSGQLIKGTKGEVLFDTYWLTDPSKENFKTYSVYYFEIPINKGEYALGSTSGTTSTSTWNSKYTKNGAYLMYLDIGASTKNNTAITIDEHWETTEKFYKYPLGTDFKDIPSLNSSFGDVQGGESAAIRLTSENNKGSKTEYSYTSSISSSDASLVVGNESGGDYVATYKTIDTNVTTRGSPTKVIEADAYQSKSYVYDRETLYDLTSGVNDVYKTSTSTKVSIDGGEATTTESSGSITLTQEDLAKIVNVSLEDDNGNAYPLFTMEYCSPIGTDITKSIEFELAYDAVEHQYSLTFVTSLDDLPYVMLRFTTLTTSFTDSSGTTYTFSVNVKNEDKDGTVVGTVEKDKLYTIKPNQKSSS